MLLIWASCVASGAGRRESNPHDQLGSSVLHPSADLRIADQRVEWLLHRHSPLFLATACPIWHGAAKVTHHPAVSEAASNAAQIGVCAILVKGQMRVLSYVH